MSSKSNDSVFSNQDFKLVLDSLLDAYRPTLEHELRLAASADALLQDATVNPPSCDDEIATAQQLFQKFFTAEVATSLLPVEGQKALGNIDEWQWCYRHIQCCLVFGWLVCRGPRTFRGFAYYLYQYWLCVRQAIGEPVSNPPSIADKRDFSTLVRILAVAYAPSVKDDLKALEYPIDIPEEIASGSIDCNTGDASTGAIFERLLAPDAATALFGSKAAATLGNNNALSRNCRCYCIAALEFGCCLARVYSLREAVECLKEFFARLRRCFNPLTAEIDAPPACASLTFVPACGFAGLEITGTAAGAAFTSYTLSYSFGGPIVNTAVVYPDCTTPPANPSSSTPVSGGVLGYLNIDLLPPSTTSVTVYLDVYGSGGLHLQVSAVFQYQIDSILINGIATLPAAYAADPFSTSLTPPVIKLIPDSSNPGFEKSVGGGVLITGSADAQGCGNQMTQYQLAAFGPIVGAEPLPVPNPSPVPPLTSSTGLNGVPIITPVLYNPSATYPWSACSGGVSNIVTNGDLVAYWSTTECLVSLSPPTFEAEPALAYQNWSTAASGRYLVYLEVDQAPLPTLAPQTPAGEDNVVVWVDNYDVFGKITAIGNVVGCGDLYLSQYVGKTALVKGVAWDYPIDINSAQKKPNDNFDDYSLTYQKNGGSPQPFLATDYTPNGAPAGTAPTVRVPNLWQATAPDPTTQSGILASWDIVAALDGGPPADPNNPCVPPAASPWQLPRGCHCAYVINLYVYDNTWVGNGGDDHNTLTSFAINVINDIA